MTTTPSKRGGARPGAGRPKKSAPSLPIAADDPLAWLTAVANNADVAMGLRVKAAISIAQYKCPKPSAAVPSGKKQAAVDKADELLAAADCKFKPGRPPLRAVKTGR